MVLGLCNSIEAIISEIVLCKTTLALPVRLRTEPVNAGPVTLYSLRGQAVRIKEIKQTRPRGLMLTCEEFISYLT